PNARSANAIYRSSQRHRHFGMRANAETLTHHQPLSETAFSEKVVIGILHTKADNNPNAGAEQQIADQEDPVKDCNLHSAGVYLRFGGEKTIAKKTPSQKRKAE